MHDPCSGLDNSKEKAELGCKYNRQKKPNGGNLKDVIDILNVWGCYVEAWGKRVREALKAYEEHTTHPPGHPMVSGGKGEKMSKEKILMHLDPPPPPWDEA